MIDTSTIIYFIINNEKIIITMIILIVIEIERNPPFIGNERTLPYPENRHTLIPEIRPNFR